VGPSDGSDAFYVYSFKVLPVLQVNDKIAVKGELRFIDRGVLGATDLGQSTNMKLYHLYMEWTSPYGKTRFGRTPAGAWGTSKFNDSTRQGQRLMWWPNMMPENWSTLVFTEKLNEVDATNGPNVSDEDRDAYYLGTAYKADFGPTNAALWIIRDARELGANTSPYTSMNLWLNGKYQFDAITFEWEADWGFGEAGVNSLGQDADQKSLALMGDLSFKTGDFTIGGLALYCSGDSTGTDGDAETACANTKGTGRDFNPYQIMMGDYMNLWNADNPLSGNSIHPSLKTAGGNVGLWSLGANGKFAMSPDMTISGEIGYFAAAEEPGGWDDEFGWEIGVGMGYKLMDNLTYNAHFSYLMTGDFFKEGSSNLATEDIYLVAHALSMKF
jgi:opacity protein-like surface antigen